jgi:hypothetical protein
MLYLLLFSKPVTIS